MKKVLVVDDSAIVISVIKRYLVSCGYLVETMDSPFGVSNTIRRFGPDVVLMDLNMPGLRGESLLSLFKNKEENRFRIIVISSEEEIELRTVVSSGLADDYFVKGTPLEVLGSKIESQFGYIAAIPGGPMTLVPSAVT